MQTPSPTHARLSLSQRRSIAVLVGFLVFVALSLAVAYGTSGLPSPQQACAKKCSANGHTGTLVYSGPATTKDFYKDANSTCSCQ